MLRPSPNRGTQRLPNDDDDDGSLLNILQLFASFIQNLKLLQWRAVLTTLEICRVMF